MIKRTLAYAAGAAFIGAFAVMLGAAAAHAQVYTSSSSASTTPPASAGIPSSVDTSATDSIYISNPSANSSSNSSSYPTYYPTTVGAPNTGAGGNAPLNVAILLSSGMMAVGGSLYLAKKKYEIG